MWIKPVSIEDSSLNKLTMMILKWAKKGEFFTPLVAYSIMIKDDEEIIKISNIIRERLHQQ